MRQDVNKRRQRVLAGTEDAIYTPSVSRFCPDEREKRYYITERTKKEVCRDYKRGEENGGRRRGGGGEEEDVDEKLRGGQTGKNGRSLAELRKVFIRDICLPFFSFPRALASSTNEVDHGNFNLTTGGES